ncbi:hypothetical protein ACSV9I_21335 [Rhizobium sp. G187]|uniref:hypothetical protein n=1 Tax=Rhizobium sp. G187 TaxID=3451352 RepID=UPI003EE6C8B7
MAKQTKPFIVEIKPSRKPKPNARKPSIWGSLDLKPDPAADSDTRSAPLGSSATIKIGRS